MANKKRLIDANEAYEIARDSGCHNDFARSMADLASLREVLEECTTVDAVVAVRRMLCPITNRHCDNTRCGWWSEDSQKCAVLVVAESLKKAVKK